MAQLDDDHDRGRKNNLLAFLLSLTAAIVAATVTWLFTLSLSQLETTGAVGTVAVGVALIVRCGIHVRQRYLRWRGTGKHPWSASRSRRLALITVAGGVLALAVTAAGVRFLADTEGVAQLIATFVLLVFVIAEIEATRRTIQAPGGPKPGSDVIEQCGPVRAALHPKRMWNGKWGVDALVEVIGEKVPVGHRSQAAVLLVVALFFFFVVQAAAVVGDFATSREQQTPEVDKNPPSPEAPPSAVTKGPVSSEDESTGGGGERTYEDNCGREVTPGDGAPEPLRADLRGAWAALGPAAGCALRARKLSPGTYLAEGQCQGRSWSFGIVSWDRSAAVLIEDAAVAGVEIAKREPLSGASLRIDLVEGDFHLVYTPSGSYLVIREAKTDGNGSAGKVESCADIEPGVEKYAVLFPGMAELWLRFVETTGMQAWPSEAARSWQDEPADFVLYGRGGGVEVAWGSCASPIECELRSAYGSMSSSSAGIEQVTVQRIVQRFPG